LPIANGGTGLTTTPANGQILIGNGTNYSISALTAGSGISITNGSGSITIANTGGGGSGASRTAIAVTTATLASGASANLSLTGYKGYNLYSIQVSSAAWVTVYSSVAARTADASRTITTSPTPGSGVIAEMISTGGITQLITPAAAGFSSESPPTTSIPLKIVNNSNGVATTITVTLTLVQTEV
jgi:hypothetical protein